MSHNVQAEIKIGVVSGNFWIGETLEEEKGGKESGLSSSSLDVVEVYKDIITTILKLSWPLKKMTTL